MLLFNWIPFAESGQKLSGSVIKSVVTCAEKNDLEAIREILTKNPGLVNGKDRGGTPIILQAFLFAVDKFEVVKAFADAGANGNMSRVLKLIADEEASEIDGKKENYYRLIQFLLNHGVDFNVCLIQFISEKWKKFPAMQSLVIRRAQAVDNLVIGGSKVEKYIHENKHLIHEMAFLPVGDGVYSEGGLDDSSTENTPAQYPECTAPPKLNAIRTISKEQALQSLFRLLKQNEPDEDLLKILLAMYPETVLDQADDDDCTPLYYAAVGGNYLCAKQLLEAGHSAEKLNPRRGKPDAITVVAQKGYSVVMELLLDRGAPADGYEGAIGLPLKAAIEYNHESVVKLLLERSSQCAQVGSRHTRALALSVDQIFGTVDEDQRYKLWLTVEKKLHEQKNAWQELIDSKTEQQAYQRCQDGMPPVPHGLYPLHLMLLQGEAALPVVRLSLENGCCLPFLDDTDKNGLSPLMIACQNGWSGLVSTLLDYHADVNKHATVAPYPTALMLAVQKGNEHVVKKLLDAGAMLHRRDAKNRLARDYVVAGNEQVKRLINSLEQQLQTLSSPLASSYLQAKKARKDSGLQLSKRSMATQVSFPSEVEREYQQQTEAQLAKQRHRIADLEIRIQDLSKPLGEPADAPEESLLDMVDKWSETKTKNEYKELHKKNIHRGRYAEEAKKTASRLSAENCRLKEHLSTMKKKHEFELEQLVSELESTLLHLKKAQSKQDALEAKYKLLHQYTVGFRRKAVSLCGAEPLAGLTSRPVVSESLLAILPERVRRQLVLLDMAEIVPPEMLDTVDQYEWSFDVKPGNKPALPAMFPAEAAACFPDVYVLLKSLSDKTGSELSVFDADFIIWYKWFIDPLMVLAESGYDYQLASSPDAEPNVNLIWPQHLYCIDEMFDNASVECERMTRAINTLKRNISELTDFATTKNKKGMCFKAYRLSCSVFSYLSYAKKAALFQQEIPLAFSEEQLTHILDCIQSSHLPNAEAFGVELDSEETLKSCSLSEVFLSSWVTSQLDVIGRLDIRKKSRFSPVSAVDEGTVSGGKMALAGYLLGDLDAFFLDQTIKFAEQSITLCNNPVKVIETVKDCTSCMNWEKRGKELTLHVCGDNEEGELEKLKILALADQFGTDIERAKSLLNVLEKEFRECHLHRYIYCCYQEFLEELICKQVSNMLVEKLADYNQEAGYSDILEMGQITGTHLYKLEKMNRERIKKGTEFFIDILTGNTGMAVLQIPEESEEAGLVRIDDYVSPVMHRLFPDYGNHLSPLYAAIEEKVKQALWRIRQGMRQARAEDDR